MKLLFTIFSIMATAASVAASTYQITVDSLKAHELVLAHDSLEGRRVGEAGEWKAAQYIIGVFERAGLQPKGENGSWLQEFEFVKAIEYGDSNRVVVNGTPLAIGEGFIPMKQSASASFDFAEVIAVGYGITVDTSEGQYDDYAGKDVAGKAVVIKRYSPGKDANPHLDWDKYASLMSKINNAIEHDAAGIFFVTPEDQEDTLMEMGVTNITPKEIPIVHLRRDALQKLGVSLTEPQIASIEGVVELEKVRDTGYNVVGYLPGQTDSAIVIGAHYDHLGYGGPGSGSRYVGTEKLIHNGADDNGSGTSVLLELARQFGSKQDELRHSLLFAAFSGEEFGILGSGHYAKNMTIDSSKVRMMINMDMIGRLAEQDSGLAVLGTGTTAEFAAYFDSLKRDDVKIVQKKAGQGPSDHTAFYNRDIPVLMFFTGAHNDYHKPEDDLEKIDYAGLVTVADVVSDVVAHFDGYNGALAFVKTADPSEGKRQSQFKVTLGIMPDYVAEVKGVKVDNVVPERPAEKAGILAGDIVVKMGDIEIGDIYDYMGALGSFKKGDTCVVRVLRGEAPVEVTVVF